MREIDAVIREYCDQSLPAAPAWIRILEPRFPRIAARLDSGRSVRREIEDHFRDSYEAGLSNGQNPDSAWQFARDHFGDVEHISKEIRKARTQSYTCLSIRLMAIIALIVLPLGKLARLHPPEFLHLPSLGLMAASAAVGLLITRKRDLESLRNYALYGSWLGLLYGIFRAVTVQKAPSEIGAAIAMILLSTFFGLFLAAPASRGYLAVIMMALCQFGVLISMKRVGILFLRPGVFDADLVKTVAAFSVVSVFFGLVVFDIRKLHRRLPAVAVFGMVFACIRILSNLRRPYASLIYFVCATSIPPLMAVLMALPIHKLQKRLLQKAS
ncbi:MAG TPA: hypothetical protein VMG30_20785 [Acidobacteriota bacterium]|nr:hypothetical protein [Acidobacteriota bacterium]